MRVKQACKNFAVSAITAAVGDREGYVTTPVLRGPARGLKLRLNLKTFIEPAYLIGTYEPAEVKFVTGFVRKDWVVWDCGIYLGFYSALFAKLARQVVCFEPDPANIKRTKETLALNGLNNASFVEAAVWRPETRVELVVSGDTNSHVAGAFIGVDRDDYATRERDDGRLSVRSISLDEALNEVPAPNLIKLDIEGAEGEALQYTERLCREVKSHFIIELHNPECDEATWEWSRRYNYSLTTFGGAPITRREDVTGALVCSPVVA